MNTTKRKHPDTNKITHAIILGQFERAVRLLERKRKTKPAAQAHLAALVTASLLDPEGLHNSPQCAIAWIDYLDER